MSHEVEDRKEISYTRPRARLGSATVIGDSEHAHLHVRQIIALWNHWYEFEAAHPKGDGSNKLYT